MKRTKQLAVHLTPEEVEEIQTFLFDNRIRSVSEFIRKAIWAYIRK